MCGGREGKEEEGEGGGKRKRKEKKKGRGGGGRREIKGNDSTRELESYTLTFQSSLSHWSQLTPFPHMQQLLPLECSPPCTPVGKGLKSAGSLHQYPATIEHRQMDRQMDRQKYRQADRQTDRQTEAYHTNVAVDDGLLLNPSLPETWIVKTCPQEVKYCRGIHPANKILKINTA